MKVQLMIGFRNCLGSAIFLGLMVLVCLPTTVDAQQDTTTTTWFVVRHADRDGKNDRLTDSGRQRAEALAELMKNFGIDAVYSTKYERTQKTAAPTADQAGVQIKEYGKTTEDWIAKLKSHHAGQNVLIVGHSNTTGEIARLLGSTCKVEIEEDEFDQLFIVTEDFDSIHSIRIAYGESGK